MNLKARAFLFNSLRVSHAQLGYLELETNRLRSLLLNPATRSGSMHLRGRETKQMENRTKPFLGHPMGLSISVDRALMQKSKELQKNHRHNAYFPIGCTKKVV